MTLDSILRNIVCDNSVILTDSAHKSLRHIKDNVFYIESQFNEIQKNSNSKFILFSAPGASGKSTLAKHIAYKYK